jgi:hypothetical protein
MIAAVHIPAAFGVDFIFGDRRAVARHFSSSSTSWAMTTSSVVRETYHRKFIALCAAGRKHDTPL